MTFIQVEQDSIDFSSDEDEKVESESNNNNPDDDSRRPRPVKETSVQTKEKRVGVTHGVIRRKAGKPLVISSSRPFVDRPPLKQKRKARDPRLSDLSGTFDEMRFASQFSFLDDIMDKEREELAINLKSRRGCSGKEKEGIRRELDKLNGIHRSRMEKTVTREVLKGHYQKELEHMRDKGGVDHTMKHPTKGFMVTEVKERMRRELTKEKLGALRKSMKQRRDKANQKSS